MVALLGRYREYAIGILFCSLLVAVSAGCGSSKDPRQYHVWGTVTYQGKPLPAGSITFEPDASKGNKGPAVSVKIKDGKYDTRREGVGHIGGPHVVRIVGLSGEGSSDEFFPEGTPLFPEWRTTVDLPKAGSEQDFEVPATWKAAPTRGPTPFPMGP